MNLSNIASALQLNENVYGIYWLYVSNRTIVMLIIEVFIGSKCQIVPLKGSQRYLLIISVKS